MAKLRSLEVLGAKMDRWLHILWVPVALTGPQSEFLMSSRKHGCQMMTWNGSNIAQNTGLWITKDFSTLDMMLLKVMVNWSLGRRQRNSKIKKFIIIKLVRPKTKMSRFTKTKRTLIGYSVCPWHKMANSCFFLLEDRLKNYLLSTLLHILRTLSSHWLLSSLLSENGRENSHSFTTLTPSSSSERTTKLLKGGSSRWISINRLKRTGKMC